MVVRWVIETKTRIYGVVFVVEDLDFGLKGAQVLILGYGRMH